MCDRACHNEQAVFLVLTLTLNILTTSSKLAGSDSQLLHLSLILNMGMGLGKDTQLCAINTVYPLYFEDIVR